MANNLSQRIFFNINWILIEKISKALLTALTSLVIARVLGSEGIGIISIALTLYAVFTIFGTLGLERVIVRDLQDPKRDKERLMGAVVILRLIGAAIAFVGLNSTVWWFYADNLSLKMMCLILSTAFFITVGDAFEAVYRTQLRSKYVTIVRVLGLFSSALCKLSILYFEADIIWFAVPVVLETAIICSAFLYLRVSDAKLSLGKLVFRFSEVKGLLLFSWPLALSGLAGNLYFHADKIIIHHLIDASALGKYALLFQLVSILLFVFNSINLSVTPVLNRLHFESSSLFWRKYHEITALKLLLAFGMGTGLMLLGNIVIPFLVGDEFSYSTEVLAIFSTYIVFVAMCSLKSEYCVLIGVVKPLFYMRIVTLGINVLLNLWLIPKWGLAGAACATVASYAINELVFPVFIKEMRVVVLNNLLALREFTNRSFYSSLNAQLKKLF